MATSLDKLKATGTIVVSDSGDFDGETIPDFPVYSEYNKNDGSQEVQSTHLTSPSSLCSYCLEIYS